MLGVDCVALALGLLAAEESGVAVLLLVLDPTLLLALDCELASGVVEALAEVFGDVLDVEEDEFGEELFGEVLVLLFGLVLCEPVLGVAELEPALPEMLPAVFWSVLEGVAEAAPLALEALALETVRSSFTFLTPATDLAIFFASFLSSLLATWPESITVPLSTLTWTFCRAGLAASCS